MDDESDEVLRRGQLARKLNGDIVSWELRVVTLTADHITISSDSTEGAAFGIIRERIKLLDITSLEAMEDAEGYAEAIQQAHGKSWEIRGGIDAADSLTRKMKSIESLTHKKMHKTKQTGTFHGLEYLNSFQIHIAHLGRTYYFKARTPDETDAWIAGWVRFSRPKHVLESLYKLTKGIFWVQR